jgi:hypothetical protein
VDARQPHALRDSADRSGWDALTLTFSASLESIPTRLIVRQYGSNLPPPDIDFVEGVRPDLYEVGLTEPVRPGTWTCVYHIPTGTQACLGFLPGDVDGDGVVEATDVTNLADCLTGAAHCELHQCDIDRSGVCDSWDILREIDLLNGAESFEAWLGKSLIPCP